MIAADAQMVGMVRDDDGDGDGNGAQIVYNVWCDSVIPLYTLVIYHLNGHVAPHDLEMMHTLGCWVF